MSEIFGSFIESDECNEFLIISFSPDTLPIQDRWRNNSISADFLADYWGAFFPVHGDYPSQNEKAEVRDTVSYIANELLENAIKFSCHTSKYPIKIGLYLTCEDLKFYVSNGIASDAIEPFQNFIRILLSENIGELYINQLEKNAMDDTASGMGFLTLLNDYGAQLAWKFETLQKDPGIIIVTTMVKLSVSRSCRI